MQGFQVFVFMHISFSLFNCLSGKTSCLHHLESVEHLRLMAHVLPDQVLYDCSSQLQAGQLPYCTDCSYQSFELADGAPQVH